MRSSGELVDTRTRLVSFTAYFREEFPQQAGVSTVHSVEAYHIRISARAHSGLEFWAGNRRRILFQRLSREILPIPRGRLVALPDMWNW